MKAYKHKGMKAPRPEKKMEVKTEMASMAPSHKPSHKMSHQKAEYSRPMGGEQSMAPSHKGKAMPSAHAPKGVAGVNGGKSVSMPKCGGVGESEC